MFRFHNLVTCLRSLAYFLVLGAASAGFAEAVAISDGPSIQRALDSSPGRIVMLPPGDYEITEPIVIKHANSGLVGPGRIVQTNPEQPMLIVSNADGVQLRDFTLTRGTDQDGSTSGLIANSARNLVIDNVQLLDNRSASSAINIDKCVNGRLTNSIVRNYTRLSVDDRTANPDLGYAFKCFDGTGIQLTGCRGMLVQGNLVEETHNVPTPEIKERYGLGKFTKKNAVKGALVSQEVWDREEFPQWHQGSAIHIGEPEQAGLIRLIGNQVENAAQGFDIHADQVIAAQNIVNNAAVGLKAMHGSRNVLIMGNQFNRCCCHAILLQPGAASHSGDSTAGKGPNSDGASIIANNICTNFGYGDSNFMWGNERDVICLEPGQTPQNPALADVIVQGNVIDDASSEQRQFKNPNPELKPRYRFALLVSKDTGDNKGPVRVRISDNIFPPGSGGVSNIRVRQ